MRDHFFHNPDGHERRNVPRTHSQYPILQLQFRPPEQSVPARDRYRVARHHHEPVYDRVEDEDEYGEEPPFDSFGAFSESAVC
jgi:hypothetical protein